MFVCVCVCVCVSKSSPTSMAVPAGDGAAVHLKESPPLLSGCLTWPEPPPFFIPPSSFVLKIRGSSCENDDIFDHK